jgi:hypothetical protein
MVDLFACYKGQFGSIQNVVVWKMVLSFVMWCLWRERNDRCFEDCERTMVELKAFFFKTLYRWAAAFGINIAFIFFFICFLFLVRCISFVLFLLYLGCAFALFKKIAMTYKNKLETNSKLVRCFWKVSSVEIFHCALYNYAMTLHYVISLW